MTGRFLEIGNLPKLIALLKSLLGYTIYTRIYFLSSLTRMESLEGPVKKGILVELDLLSTCIEKKKTKNLH